MANFQVENKILGLLGTLWTKNYAKNGACHTLVETNLDLMAQVQQDLQETIDCIDRHTVPLYHTELWYPLHIYEEQLWSNGACDMYTVPADLVALPLLLNRITAPSLVWQADIDFGLHEKEGKKALSFENRLFDTPLLPTTGPKGHRELMLWGYGVNFDRQYLQRHFGCVAALEMATSQHYKEVLNVIFDFWAYGATFSTFEAAVNVLLGVPRTGQLPETLQGLYNDRCGPFIATDVSIYRLQPAWLQWANLSVQPGTVLLPGTPIVKVAKITLNAHTIQVCTPTLVDECIIRAIAPPEMRITFECAPAAC